MVIVVFALVDPEAGLKVTQGCVLDAVQEQPPPIILNDVA